MYIYIHIHSPQTDIFPVSELHHQLQVCYNGIHTKHSMEVAVKCPIGGEHTQTGVNGSEKKEGNVQ